MDVGVGKGVYVAGSGGNGVWLAVGVWYGVRSARVLVKGAGGLTVSAVEGLTVWQAVS